MEEPFLILGREAVLETFIDGYSLVKSWAVQVGAFVVEVHANSEGAAFTGRLFWGAGNSSCSFATRDAARDWVEQEAKRRAREMVELAANNTESAELARVQVLARVERGGRIVVEKVD